MPGDRSAVVAVLGHGRSSRRGDDRLRRGHWRQSRGHLDANPVELQSDLERHEATRSTSRLPGRYWVLRADGQVAGLPYGVTASSSGRFVRRFRVSMPPIWPRRSPADGHDLLGVTSEVSVAANFTGRWTERTGTAPWWTTHSASTCLETSSRRHRARTPAPRGARRPPTRHGLVVAVPGRNGLRPFGCRGRGRPRALDPAAFRVGRRWRQVPRAERPSPLVASPASVPSSPRPVGGGAVTRRRASVPSANGWRDRRGPPTPSSMPSSPILAPTRSIVGSASSACREMLAYRFSDARQPARGSRP